MENMHITEAELVRDINTILDRVQSGAEIIVERNATPVAVIRPAVPGGRKISEIIAAMEASGAGGIADEDFARDVEEGIASRQEPWNPPTWDS